MCQQQRRGVGIAFAIAQVHLRFAVAVAPAQQDVLHLFVGNVAQQVGGDVAAAYAFEFQVERKAGADGQMQRATSLDFIHATQLVVLQFATKVVAESEQVVCQLQVQRLVVVLGV